MRPCATNVFAGFCWVLASLPLVALGQDPEPVRPKPAGYFVPGPARTSEQLRESVSGLSLPVGFHGRISPDSPTGQVGGFITGPEKLEIYYNVAPTGAYQLAPSQAYFSSTAREMKEGEHRWSREQYIADERVEITLNMDDTLAVSFPGRGVNFISHVKGMGQLSDVLLVAFSITNRDRRVSWDEAKKLIASENVHSITKLHTGAVTIHFEDGTTCYTQDTPDDDVVSFVRKIGKAKKIGIALD